MPIERPGQRSGELMRMERFGSISICGGRALWSIVSRTGNSNRRSNHLLPGQSNGKTSDEYGIAGTGSDPCEKRFGLLVIDDTPCRAP
jgi:hypothetical protein